MVLQCGTDEYKVSKKGNLDGRAAIAGTPAIFGKMPALGISQHIFSAWNLRKATGLAIRGVRVGDYASIMRTIMKTIMGPLFEPETPSKCFFEARGDVASPNEAGGIIVEAIIVPISNHS
ncbi:hypothetical protein ARMGADRAFT_1033187 [Armillaria gallica]|uniref:Uncharacterized protein n=1 Tax=Armillaria gallica TaxID=47427 RepID=A0A2H3D2Z9_ARMGA|nr:hypothetical protein ARMGADRAFT_1033187 [Armillaria gallica]